MTAFDIFVLTLIAGGGILGFMRGLVQESLALGAWVAAIIAIRFFHDPLSVYLTESVGTESGASALAFVLLWVIPYSGGRLLARSLGAKSRSSALGPFDRVLGFGFGAAKGLIMSTLAFLAVTMVSDLIWPAQPHAEWLRESRTYPLMNASANALSSFVEERRKEAELEAAEQAPGKP